VSETPLTPEWMALIIEILIRKYGNQNVLVIEDFRQALVGGPVRFGLTAGVYGDDLILSIKSTSEETISLADLETEEWKENEGESTVH